MAKKTKQQASTTDAEATQSVAEEAPAAEESVSVDQPANRQPGMPMFYNRPVPLDSGRHAGKALTAARDFDFAARSNSVPLTHDEFPVAIRHFPIVFTAGDPAVPVAVLGLQKSENLFVDADGRWADGVYVPGYVRRYPFIFLERPEQSQFALCIDEDSNLIEDGTGERALFADGEPTGLTKRALDFCSAYHRQFIATREFCEALKTSGILEEKTANITVGGDQRIALQGLRLIDEEKFRALPDETFLEWRRRRWLPAVYCQVMSQNNWALLARRMGARLRAAGAEPAA
jgi:hypothetical protein